MLIDISCFSDSDTQRLIAQAWVKREASTPALNKELQSATTLEKAILYAKNGFWFEALTTVAELRRSNPQDPQWSHLLQSADFGDFANEPIVNCCISQKSVPNPE
ncbi:DUF928 domain-containing protein [Nostoc sp. FACHB-110]|nr:DUF928 domain-containing protein [Nostoc sp. FACHB-110]